MFKEKISVAVNEIYLLLKHFMPVVQVQIRAQWGCLCHIVIICLPRYMPHHPTIGSEDEPQA